MTTMLTFQDANASGRRTPRWAMGLAAVLIAVAAPTVACEKSGSTWIAGQGPSRTVATFTGEFVNGAPVYRLPAITVGAPRELEIAKTPRDAAQPRAARFPAGSAPAAVTPKRKVASASYEPIAKPCVG